MSISPPPKRRKQATHGTSAGRVSSNNHGATRVSSGPGESHDTPLTTAPSRPAVPTTHIDSPVKLNTIAQLPGSSNIDTISLRDVLGHPLSRECWLFNYLFDIDYIRSHFDPDIRDAVQLRLVHGSWKREDANGIHIRDACQRYANVEQVTAHLPDPFGTHHTKMAVIFRHDDVAQVVILTGNFIAQDWIMSQAVWSSPMLPLQQNAASTTESAALGTGPRFKSDFLSYLQSYGDRLKPLWVQLEQYDFGAVRGAFIASSPGRTPTPALADPPSKYLRGWPALQRALSQVPVHSDKTSQVVCQVSSVASVGEKWLAEVFFPAVSAGRSTSTSKRRPTSSIVYPTPAEIRQSISGYSSGASIHMKTQTAAQVKQLDFIRPMRCRWGESASTSVSPGVLHGKAGRSSAAPHIKTYLRFADETMQTIDWALVTSANLSTQAWGSAPHASTPSTNKSKAPAGKAGDVRVSSYEAGILLWPDLWNDSEKSQACTMVPHFPGAPQPPPTRQYGFTVVKWNMPYDLPLHRYTLDDEPWSAGAATASSPPDRFGRRWMF